jgi:hypothetical protein
MTGIAFLLTTLACSQSQDLDRNPAPINPLVNIANGLFMAKGDIKERIPEKLQQEIASLPLMKLTKLKSGGYGYLADGMGFYVSKDILMLKRFRAFEILGSEVCKVRGQLQFNQMELEMPIAKLSGPAQEALKLLLERSLENGKIKKDGPGMIKIRRSYQRVYDLPNGGGVSVGTK